MTLRFQRLMLRALALSLFVAAGTVIAAALSLPDAQPTRHSAGGGDVAAPAPAGPEPESASNAPAPDSAAWRRPLRRPLYDPPPPPPPPVVKKKLPPLRAKLHGTILSPDSSQAMIGVPGKSVRFLSEGDPLGPPDRDAVLVEIGPDWVKVARGDEVTRLKVESPY